MSIGKEMFYCKSNGDYVFKQNDEAQLFFIIEKGEVEVEIDGNQRKKLTKSDGFGDLALLYNAPRSASIRCIGTCFFWGIDRSSFKKAVEEAIMCGYDANREFLDRIPFFSKHPGICPIN
jgi:cGMP-dependent protein kinase 1